MSIFVYIYFQKSAVIDKIEDKSAILSIEISPDKPYLEAKINSHLQENIGTSKKYNQNYEKNYNSQIEAPSLNSTSFTANGSAGSPSSATRSRSATRLMNSKSNSSSELVTLTVSFSGLEVPTHWIKG